MRKHTIRVRDRITIRRCDTGAVAESTEFSVAFVDRVERELFVNILEGTALLPIDVEEGMWRIDRVHDWLAHKLLQEDLKEFVLSDGPSEGVLRWLVVEDMDEESRAVLNDFRMSEEVLAEVEPILQGMRLDDSQKRAVIYCLKRRIGVVQGPPGTGKTTFGNVVLIILIFLITKNVETRILLTASSSSAVDNLLQRLRGDKDKLLQSCNAVGLVSLDVIRRYGIHLAPGFKNS